MISETDDLPQSTYGSSSQPAPLNDEPSQVWAKTLAQLKGQMERQTFNLWLSTSWLVEAHGNVWTIGVRSAQACEWLSQRLAPLIERSASYVAGYDVRTEFVVGADARTDADKSRVPSRTPRP